MNLLKISQLANQLEFKARESEFKSNLLIMMVLLFKLWYLSFYLWIFELHSKKKIKLLYFLGNLWMKMKLIYFLLPSFPPITQFWLLTFFSAIFLILYLYMYWYPVTWFADLNNIFGPTTRNEKIHKYLHCPPYSLYHLIFLIIFVHYLSS